jgi:hypothetical protein
MQVAVPCKIYDPVGHCIYCGDRAGPLRVEHIVPRGVWGLLELPQASCLTCQGLISPVEARVQNNFWGPFRLQTGPGPRHGKKRRGRVRIRKPSADGTPEPVLVPLEDYPRAFPMPLLPPPALLGSSPQEPSLVMIVNAPDVQRVLATHGPGAGPEIKFNAIDFGRMLAKIAHAYVAAEMPNAADDFSLLLPQFIRDGAAKFPSALMGGSLNPVNDTNYMYELRIWQGATSTSEYLIVTVRLFAAMRAPAYDVVVGSRPLTRKPSTP